MITAENISLKIKGRSILDNAYISIPNGKIVGLAGTNGAGKSTFLKILIGQHQKYQGNVSYDGKNLADLSLDTLSKMRAVLPQETATTFPVIAKDIIDLGRSFFKEDLQEKNRVTEEVIDKVRAHKFSQQYYDSLSGGEKQRVQLARVLAQIWTGETNRYLFLDEPISSLDIALQHEILAMLNEVKQKNIGVLVVLHDVNLLLQYCDEICFLKNGKVVTQDTPQMVANENLLSYIYDFPMSIHQLNNKPYVLPQEKEIIIQLIKKQKNERNNSINQTI